MDTGVNRRRYDGRSRRLRAAQTRSRILDAARRLFTERGYAATSVQDIALAAGVSVDTLYASVGRKPQLLLAVHDMLLAEGEAPVAVEQRTYVQQIHAASTAEAKIRVYAEALGRLLPHTVPLQEALRDAGATDASCREVYDALSERRASNMRLFVAELRDTGELRDDISDDIAATLIWSMNSPEYFTLVRGQGLIADQYATLIGDVWARFLLDSPGQRV
jgi:AcrR family transcriptional regulator